MVGATPPRTTAEAMTPDVRRRKGAGGGDAVRVADHRLPSSLSRGANAGNKIEDARGVRGTEGAPRMFQGRARRPVTFDRIVGGVRGARIARDAPAHSPRAP